MPGPVEPVLFFAVGSPSFTPPAGGGASEDFASLDHVSGRFHIKTLASAEQVISTRLDTSCVHCGMIDVCARQESTKSSWECEEI